MWEFLSSTLALVWTSLLVHPASQHARAPRSVNRLKTSLTCEWHQVWNDGQILTEDSMLIAYVASTVQVKAIIRIRGFWLCAVQHLEESATSSILRMFRCTWPWHTWPCYTWPCYTWLRYTWPGTTPTPGRYTTCGLCNQSAGSRRHFLGRRHPPLSEEIQFRTVTSMFIERQ